MPHSWHGHIRIKMKKTFSLTHEKIKTPRLVDSIKHDVKKYLKRERNKKLPQDADYWDFDCKYGKTETMSDVVHVSTLNKCIDQAVEESLASFYLEIIAKPMERKSNPALEDVSGFDEDELASED